MATTPATDADPVDTPTSTSNSCPVAVTKPREWEPPGGLVRKPMRHGVDRWPRRPR